MADNGERYIYVLTNNDDVHYVGKTKNIGDRRSSHKKKYPSSVFEVIDIVPIVEWKFWERHYISLYRSWGFKLDNKRLYGGNGCDIVSEETRRKIGLAQIGNKNNLGRVVTKEHRKNLSEAHKGQKAWNKGLKTGPLSEQDKLNKSIAAKKRWVNYKLTINKHGR